MDKHIIKNIRIYDFDNYIESGFVVFNSKIIECGDMNNYQGDEFYKGASILDGKGKLLMPGLVCAHAHIYSLFARGLILPFNPKNFQDILDQMWWKIDHHIDNDITYYSGLMASIEFMKNGVTTIIDHHASGKDILGSLNSLKKAIVDDAKLRAILCFETSDRYNIEQCIKENIDCINDHSNYCAGLFGMHASMSIGDDTLLKIKKSLNDAPLHVHVAESEMDEQHCIQHYNKSVIERFNDYKIINKNSLMVHGIYLNDKELDIIKENGAYLVVNTTSNMNNSVGLPNIKNYLNKGIKVMIGNDGLSTSIANEYVNALFTSHIVNKSPKDLNVGDILTMINNAYEYVSNILNIKLGRITKDYEADLLLVDYKPFTNMNKDNAFGHILYGLFSSFKPQDVYTRGNKIVSNYNVVDNKLINEYGNALKASKHLWKEITKGE